MDKLWQKIIYGMGTTCISALCTIAFFEAVIPKSAVKSVVPTAARAPLPQNPVGPKKVQPSLFALDLVGLRQLHRQATPVTIDRLTAEDRAYDSTAMSFQAQMVSNTIVPLQYRININPTNFGDRFTKDLQGHPVHHRLLIVLHETTGTASGAISAMLTTHLRDQDQSSYHAIIRQDGAIVYLVDPAKRAYGAGDSLFKGAQGDETVKTKQTLPPSVNNFAYHIALETPVDGQDNAEPTHSGYTEAQYESLAWLVTQSKVSGDRIATHAAIDQSGERQDPRSFDMERLRDTLLLQTDPLVSLNPTPLP